MADAIPEWLAAKVGADRVGVRNLAAVELCDAKTYERSGFKLTSAAFSDGGELDPCFTADEEDAVAPPMEWTAPPPGVQEVVLIVEDADAQGGKPACHWLVWGLPGQRGQILEGETPPRTGKNALGNSEWLLPQPPADDAPHLYVFQLFALDLPLTLMPGATRDQLVDQLRGHVVACSVLTASYARQADEGEWNEDEV